MRILILCILLFPTILQARDLLTSQEYQQFSTQQQVEILTAYKAFVQEVSRNEDELEMEELSTNFNFHLLIDQAFAAAKYNCFYAGWPSYKKTVMVKGRQKSFCTSPTKSNPDYKILSKSCHSGEMLCQPALFGSPMCIKAQTQAQRNLAFSQCQTKFVASGKTLSDLAKELSHSAAAADELFELVHGICSSGLQSRTAMCKNLKRRVSTIRAQETKTVVKPKAKKIQVINQGKPTEDEVLKEELISTVEKVIEHTAPQITKEITKEVTCAQCEQIKAAQKEDEILADYEVSESIDQSKSTSDDFCTGGEYGNPRDKMYENVHYDKQSDLSINVEYQDAKQEKSPKFPASYEINIDKIGDDYSAITKGQENNSEGLIQAKRAYNNSFLSRGKENSFEIIENPVRTDYINGKIDERYVSEDLRISRYAFFPRKVVPSVKLRDDKIIMKMTTGEEFVMNAKSGKIISGVAKSIPAKQKMENKTDKNGKKYVLNFPDTEFAYRGEGLYIETKLAAGTFVPVRAFVDGQMQECKMKSADLWENHQGHFSPKSDPKYSSSRWSCSKFKFEKDEDLYSMIKKQCPAFKFPALIR